MLDLFGCPRGCDGSGYFGCTFAVWVVGCLSVILFAYCLIVCYVSLLWFWISAIVFVVSALCLVTVVYLRCLGLVDICCWLC